MKYAREACYWFIASLLGLALLSNYWAYLEFGGFDRYRFVGLEVYGPYFEVVELSAVGNLQTATNLCITTMHLCLHNLLLYPGYYTFEAILAIGVTYLLVSGRIMRLGDLPQLERQARHAFTEALQSNKDMLQEARDNGEPPLAIARHLYWAYVGATANWLVVMLGAGDVAKFLRFRK